MMGYRPGRAIVIPGIGTQIHSQRATEASAGSWWDNNGLISGCVAAYDPFVAASQAASYVNLKNPGTNDLTVGAAPAWAAGTGWTFTAASSQYLITGLVPSSGWSAIAKINSVTFGATQRAIFGCFNNTGSKRWFVWAGDASANRLYAAGATLSKAGRITSGTMGMAGQTAYLDGVNDGTIGAGTIPTVGIYIGASNVDGVASQFFNGVIAKIAFYNTTLSGANMATISAAM